MENVKQHTQPTGMRTLIVIFYVTLFVVINQYFGGLDATQGTTITIGTLHKVANFLLFAAHALAFAYTFKNIDHENY